MRRKLRTAVLLVATPTSAGFAQGWDPGGKLTAANGQPEDYFGRSVAISGDTAVVGAHFDDDRGPNSGSAYIFQRLGILWTEVQKLTAIDGGASDEFGASASISGDIAIVGAPGDDDRGSNAGAAYVFQKIAGEWTLVRKLTASDGQASNLFGRSVSVSGTRSIVGAHSNTSNNSQGSAYVFTSIGGVWTEVQKLTASDGQLGDSFGYSVCISGDTAIVGAIGDDADAGSVYVFESLGSVWTEVQKLTAADGHVGDNFGRSLCIDGDTLVVGAQSTDNGANSGSAYVFERVDGAWTPISKLVPPDVREQDEFGTSVAVSGNTLIVGSNGDDDRGEGSGSAYVFERLGGTWTQVRKLSAFDGVGGDSFGESVAVNGDTAIVGARYDDDRGDSSGSAYVFDNSTPACPADLAPPPIGDGLVNINDFFQFLIYYEARSPAADFDPNGVININDFFDFLAAFQAGC